MRARTEGSVLRTLMAKRVVISSIFLAACLAATEDGIGGRTQRFMELLAAAIEYDRNNHQPETLGVVRDGSGLMMDTYDRSLGLEVSYDNTSL